MNEQDLITRLTQDSNLREAISRKEKHRAQKPADLDGRLMERVISSQPNRITDTKPHRARRMALRWWISAAACLLLIIGIGTTQFFDAGSEQLQPVQVQNNKSTNVLDKQYKASVPSVQTSYTGSTKHLNPTQRTKKQSAVADLSPTAHDSCDLKSNPQQHLAANILPSTLHLPLGSATLLSKEPSIINAVLSDSVQYQDPVRMDEFIAKMADYQGVKQGELTCSLPADSNMVSAVYVFPDKKETDLFSRLLQAACWYSDDTPGYFLTFSHQQFFFELKDLRQRLQYRWIAERINGKILLYGTHASLGAIESSACYQEYRDELMHTKSIHSKPKEI